MHCVVIAFPVSNSICTPLFFLSVCIQGPQVCPQFSVFRLFWGRGGASWITSSEHSQSQGTSLLGWGDLLTMGSDAHYWSPLALSLLHVSIFPPSADCCFPWRFPSRCSEQKCIESVLGIGDPCTVALPGVHSWYTLLYLSVWHSDQGCQRNTPGQGVNATPLNQGRTSSLGTVGWLRYCHHLAAQRWMRCGTNSHGVLGVADDIWGARGPSAGSLGRSGLLADV